MNHKWDKLEQTMSEIKWKVIWVRGQNIHLYSHSWVLLDLFQSLNARTEKMMNVCLMLTAIKNKLDWARRLHNEEKFKSEHHQMTHLERIAECGARESETQVVSEMKSIWLQEENVTQWCPKKQCEWAQAHHNNRQDRWLLKTKCSLW